MKKMTAKERFSWTMKEIRLNKMLYFMMLPFLIFFITFTVGPVLQAIVYSFTDFNIFQPAQYVGLRNYRELILEDAIFIKAIQNTFVMALFIGPVGYMVSFLLAWMINELPHFWATILTVIFYAPSMSGGAALIFTLIFANDRYGYLNGILLNLGIIDTPFLWLSDTSTMMPIVIVVSLWQSLGVGFLSFVAGIKGVDGAQYEAGMIDGIKNRWQELWFITLPNMKPQLLFGAVMSITGSFSVGAIADGLVGFPSPDYATHSIMNHLNDYGLIRIEMGKASAIAVILFAMMLIANSLVRKFLEKIGT